MARGGRRFPLTAEEQQALAWCADATWQSIGHDVFKDRDWHTPGPCRRDRTRLEIFTVLLDSGLLAVAVQEEVAMMRQAAGPDAGRGLLALFPKDWDAASAVARHRWLDRVFTE